MSITEQARARRRIKTLRAALSRADGKRNDAAAALRAACIEERRGPARLQVTTIAHDSGLHRDTIHRWLRDTAA